MRGFPHDLSSIDYDSAVIRQKAIILEANYVGKAPMAHCHELAFRDLTYHPARRSMASAARRCFGSATSDHGRTASQA